MWLRPGVGNGIAVDGIVTGAVAVLAATIVSSLVSWSAFSWTSRRFSFSGVLLCVITGASLALPFLDVLGPVAGLIVGVVAGFSASRLQRGMEDPSQGRPLKLAATTLVAAYLGLAAISLGAVSPPLWDGGFSPWFSYGYLDGTEVLFFDFARLVPLLVSAPSLAATVLLIRARK